MDQPDSVIPALRRVPASVRQSQNPGPKNLQDVVDEHFGHVQPPDYVPGDGGRNEY